MAAAGETRKAFGSLCSERDVVGTASAVRAGAISATDSVAEAISRIEAADPELSFLVAERFEAAMEEAGGADPSAPLAGVPILVKDANATVAGLPLSEGSSFVRGWVAERDSEYVVRLKRAGAIVLGTTTTAEFAAVTSCEPHRYGPTRNPRAPGRTTGGSSGGSAAAVAGGVVPVAHGSDAGGSIRIPAACCGLVGLKPTRGRNPLGVDERCDDACLWAEHVLTRSVRDSALLLDLTAEPAEPRAGRTGLWHFREAVERSPWPLRVAVATAMPDGGRLHPECAAAVARTAAILEELGNELVEGGPRLGLAAAEDAYFTLFSSGLAARVAEWSRRLGREPAHEDLEPYTRHLYERARTTPPQSVAAAIACLNGYAREVSSFYESVDLWLSPTLGMPPFELGHLDAGPELAVEVALERDADFSAFTWPANVTGQPALSLPVHETAEGLPLGVQLTGRFGDEATLLAVAAAIERQLGAPLAGATS